jgi:hypothetical protein
MSDNTMHVHVTVDPERANFPLRPVYAGRGSSLKIHVAGLPEGAGCKLIQALIGTGVEYEYAGALNAAGEVEVYMPPWAFPAAGQTVYQLAAVLTEAGESRTYWLGKGRLTVIDSALSAAAAPGQAFPDGAWFRMPDGLYYKLSLAVDPDTGRLTADVGQEGFTHVP